jgi:hypothetical protein
MGALFPTRMDWDKWKMNWEYSSTENTATCHRRLATGNFLTLILCIVFGEDRFLTCLKFNRDNQVIVCSSTL